MRKDFHYSFRVGTTNCIEQNGTTVSVQNNKRIHVIPSYFTIANRKKNTQLGIIFQVWKFRNLLFIIYITFIILSSLSHQYT